MSSKETVRPQICRCKADLYFWKEELTNNGPGAPCDSIGKGVAANRCSTGEESGGKGQTSNELPTGYLHTHHVRALHKVRYRCL